MPMPGRLVSYENVIDLMFTGAVKLPTGVALSWPLTCALYAYKVVRGGMLMVQLGFTKAPPSPAVLIG